MYNVYYDFLGQQVKIAANVCYQVAIQLCQREEYYYIVEI